MHTAVVTLNNQIKLYYTSCIARQTTPFEERTRENAEFFATLMDLILSIREYQNGQGDDLCIIAIMTLLWRGFALSESDICSGGSESHSDSKAAVLVQALCLARATRHVYDRSYRVTILSSRLHLVGGLSSLAFSEFRELQLKEVQWDSLGHLVYTRISTLHPFAAADEASAQLSEQFRDPLEGMQYALQWGPHASKQLVDFIAKDVHDLPFDKLREFVDFKDSIGGSFTRALLHIECRRVQRMRDEGVTVELPPRLASNTGYDQRDFKTLPNFEMCDEEEIEETLFFDVKPRKAWLARMVIYDSLVMMMESKDPSRELEEIRNAIEQIKGENFEFLLENLTASEIRADQAWEVIRRVIIWIFVGSSQDLASKNIKNDFTTLADAIRDYKLIRCEYGALPHWKYLHDRFTFIEVLKACDKLVECSADICKKQKAHHLSKGVSTESITKLRTVIKDRFVGIQEEAKSMKDKLTRGWIDEMAVKGDTGASVQKLGKDFVKTQTRWIFGSAVDALNGILKVKMKNAG